MLKPPRRKLLVLSVIAIALVTLVPGGGGSSSGCMLCSDRWLSDFIANILLFVPLGFALARRGHPLLHAVTGAALFSLGIELTQLNLISGRDSNIGDVIANTLGAMAGWSIGARRHWWLRSDDAHRRCLGVTAATLTVLVAGLGLFTPSLPDTRYYMQWTARLGHMGTYEGEVASTRIGDLQVPGGQHIEQADSVRRLLFRRPLEVVATADLRARLAPIVSIYDEDQRQIMLLGAERADLIYRYRTFADELRLDHGDIRVHQAFEHIPHGGAYRLTWSIDKQGYCLELEGRSECGRGFTVGDTWTLLQALDWGTDERTVLGTLWVLLMFVPAGLPAVRPATLLAAGVLATLTLIAAPLSMGFAITPIHQIIAALAGLVIGRFLGRKWGRESPTALISGQ